MVFPSIDTRLTWLENLLLHEYTECYLYYSCFEDESDCYIKKIWEEHFEQELAHLHKVAQLLERFEGKCWQQVIPNGCFPELLHFKPNKAYIREVMQNTITLTSVKEAYVEPCQLVHDDPFFKFQETLNHQVCSVPSHKTIEKIINEKGIDYRFEVAPHPVPSLQNRTCDNVCIGVI